MKVISKEELQHWIQQTILEEQRAELFYQAKLSVLRDQLAFVVEGKPVKKKTVKELDEEVEEDEPEETPKEEEPQGEEYESGQEVTAEEMKKLQPKPPQPKKNAGPEEDKVFDYTSDQWLSREEAERNIQEEDENKRKQAEEEEEDFS